MRRQFVPSVACAALIATLLPGCTGPSTSHAGGSSTAAPASTQASSRASAPATVPTSAATTTAPTATPSRTQDAPPAVATSAAPQPGASGAVDVVLTYAGSTDNGRTYTVAGTVTSTIEDGGTCTFTLTGPGAPVTRTQAGLADATSTSCGSVAFPAAQLRPGTWKAQVSYSGPAGRGTSPTTDVEVR